MPLFEDDPQSFLQNGFSAYNTIGVPSISSEQVENLPLETEQGTINPEQIQTANQAPSAYNNISLDPATRQAQINALRAYQDIANSGGLDANARLELQQAINAANTQSRGAQGAIMNQAQAMGQGGGDFALTQRAIAAQGASNTAAQQGLQAAAEAEANREQALNSMANIGSNINASDYGQAAQKAGAQNTINAANQSYQNNANVGNVANNMSAQQSNLQNAQNVNAANTAAQQNNVYYNAGLPQQQFNNELNKAAGIAGVSGAQANAAQQAAAQNSAMYGSLLGAAGTIIGGVYGGPAGAAVGQKAGQTAGKQMAAGGVVGYADGGFTPCYANGGMVHDHALCMKLGAVVPGKAKVAGDSEENDTVPAMLSPGELVIPRSVPKTGPAMESFAKKAPVAGTNKKVDLTSFVSGYKKPRK